MHSDYRSRWAHPRVSGENTHCKKRLERVWGSSPRERGKLKGADGKRYKAGLIPA